VDAPATTLVWMAPEAPDPSQQRALATWSRSRGVRLVAPSRSPPAWLPVDARVAAGVEALLQSAHDALGASRGEEADRAISAADSTLRAHPELPQAAWLMAEVERARAMRWRRIAPLDIEAADSAWQRAEALDGGRVAGIGEQAAAGHPAVATVALDVTPDDAQAWLDGRRVPAGVVQTLAGPHTLVVTWKGAPVSAAWIEAPAGTSTARVSEVAAPACSDEDVSRARVGVGGVDASHVRCGAWVAATSATVLAGILVATCETDHCGGLFGWRAPEPWTWSPPAERSPEGRWPAWATWTLAGAGAAVASAVVIFASGVLQPAPTEARFVSGGLKTQ
jgi:hypothetical protein